MQTIPEAGKTYASTLQPGLKLYVHEVTALTKEENEGFPATFFVEARYPEDADDMQAIGFDIDESEWNAHNFTPA